MWRHILSETAEGLAVVEAILVADDAPAMRDFMATSLLRRGYEVRVARNGQDAIAVAAAMPSIDLLVSDLSMPQVDGVTLAKRLRETRHQLPVLFVSGDPTGILPVELPAYTSFLPKPFSLDAFLAAVKRAIDECDDL